MYADDNDDQMFKYLNVFARIAECDKWKVVRKNLANNKAEQYNPDDLAPAASTGRPELGQKKLKEQKKADHPANRLQASFDKCWADAGRTPPGGTTSTTCGGRRCSPTRRPDCLAQGNLREEEEHRPGVPDPRHDANMDEETRAWYDAHRQEILQPPSAPSSPPTSTPAASTTADADASPPDATPDTDAQDGTADEHVSAVGDNAEFVFLDHRASGVVLYVHLRSKVVEKIYQRPAFDSLDYWGLGYI
ncbi:hypothetical protein QYE76_008370 [Lolium multiflorum]|uniref:F-box protein AT5G49610-like beta-propeller domain-containing protein n=1 Tax=Lolium multiflorum TaxID=4521 RepID=A0AAD8QJ06_LOLMU|nr:hypothetical protein QYE76_008370 [Lolium multiflorum]